MEIAIGLLAIAATVLGGSVARRALRPAAAPRPHRSSGILGSYLPVRARGGPQPRGRAARHPAAAAVCRRDPDLARRLPQQPGGHPQPLRRARPLHRARGRALPPVGARARLRGRLRDRRRRRAAGRGRRHGGRPPHRAAATPRVDPRGRVARQRRDGPRLPAHRARGGRARRRRRRARGDLRWRRPRLRSGPRSVASPIGFGVALVVAVLRRYFSTEPAFDTVLSFMVPFAAYVPAEELHASGVIAVVTAGLVLGPQVDRARRPAPPASASGSTGARSSSSSRTPSSSSSACRSSTSSTASAASTLSAGQITLAAVGTLVAVLLLRPLWVVPFRFVMTRVLHHEAPGAVVAHGRPVVGRHARRRHARRGPAAAPGHAAP